MIGWMMRKTNHYTEFDFHTDIRNLAQKIQADRDNWSPNVVVGLTRGGLIPAVCLSHRLGVPMIALNVSEGQVTSLTDIVFNYENILVVDEFIDTGKQLNHLFSYWFGNYAAFVRNKSNNHNIRTVINTTTELFPYENIRVAALINNKDVDKLFETSEGSIKCNYWARQISREANKDWISFWWEKQD